MRKPRIAPPEADDISFRSVALCNMMGEAGTGQNVHNLH